MTDDSSARQLADVYPDEFTLGVLPGDLAPYNCDHDSDLCYCVHDWRINWGNLPKKTSARAIYVTG